MVDLPALPPRWGIEISKFSVAPLRVTVMIAARGSSLPHLVLPIFWQRRLSLPWVVFPVNLLQPLSCDMSIDLGRCDIRMTEHYLKRAQVSAVFQKMSRKRMPEHVRGDVYADACFPRIEFDDFPDALPGYPFAAGIYKDLRDRTLLQ